MVYSTRQLSLHLALGIAVVGAMGCSSDQQVAASDFSGVDRSKYIDVLTSAEVRQLCSWSISELGGPREYACSDGLMRTVKTVEQCVATYSSIAFHCLVSVEEDCIVSANGDPCQLDVTDACKASLNCELGG